ncbi:MAG: hypothetical protein BKPUNTRY_000853 [Candidatus Fervidibacter sp.]
MAVQAPGRQLCPNPQCGAESPTTALVCGRCGTPLRQLLGRGQLVGGRYQVECVCGCGGFGAVYRAIDIVTGTPVALKENHHHRTFPRFEGEARLLMNLTHPHLPKVRSVFFDPSTGRAYMVMDFVAGETLEALVKRRGRLSWQEAQPLFSQLVAAIAFLHQHGIVHRDIKPANIIVQRRWTQAKVDEWEEVVLPPPALTEKQVARMSDATRFQRGRAYWQDGWRLQGLKRHGWTLSGTCLGGESPEDHLTYQVWAMLGNNGVVARFCDCPDFRKERFCKHLVALLLAWAHDPDKFQVVTEKIVHRVTQRPLQRPKPQWHAVLVDFGVAKVLEPVNPRRPRSSSLVAWADGYSPPEQYQNGATVGVQVDQYALAATLLFALSGETPPDALTRMALWREGKPDLPSKPFGLSPSIWQAIRIAMSFDPDHRFNSVVAFWEAVQGFGGQERGEEAPNHRPIRSNNAPQNERLVRLALLGLLGTLFSALGHWWGGAVIGVCSGALASVLGLGISQWLKSGRR